MAAKSNEADAVMLTVRERFERSEMSLDELGTKMGYPKHVARKSAWQFLKKTSDPHISMVRRFAKAIGMNLSSLIKD